MEEHITFYLIEVTDMKTLKQRPYFIGKNYHRLYFDEDIGWWEIKEFGFLDIERAKALVRKLRKSNEDNQYNIIERYLAFNSIYDKIEFINKFNLVKDNPTRSKYNEN